LSELEELDPTAILILDASKNQLERIMVHILLINVATLMFRLQLLNSFF